MESYILVSAFFIIALIYSSVGFGGGSSYLALLAQPFFALLPETIKPIVTARNNKTYCAALQHCGGYRRSYYFLPEG